MRMGLGCGAEFCFAFLVRPFPPLWSRVGPPQLSFLFWALSVKLLPVCPQSTDLGA